MATLFIWRQFRRRRWLMPPKLIFPRRANPAQRRIAARNAVKFWVRRYESAQISFTSYGSKKDWILSRTQLDFAFVEGRQFISLPFVPHFRGPKVVFWFLEFEKKMVKYEEYACNFAIIKNEILRPSNLISSLGLTSKISPMMCHSCYS